MQHKFYYKNWLSIIGIGENGVDGLNNESINRLKNAEFIFGGLRHLSYLNDQFSKNRIVWISPFKDNLKKVQELENKQVSLLVTGDPMFYGAGSIFLKYFHPKKVDVYPHISCFSLASARLGWSMQDLCFCSVHGRSIFNILSKIENKRKILMISNDGNTPSFIAKFLKEKNFSSSKITVFEHLGCIKENIISNNSQYFLNKKFSKCNIIAIDCKCDNINYNFSCHTVLPDHAFFNDGQITKKDIRSITLSYLSPKSYETLWDIGSGCGSISIDWVRIGQNSKAVAIEKNTERCDYIRKNSQYLGCPDIIIVQGEAPFVFNKLHEKPDAIFIGGGISNPNMIKSCWKKLKQFGRLVANVVTLESENIINDWAIKNQTHLVKILISNPIRTGNFHIWKQKNPITILYAEKK